MNTNSNSYTLIYASVMVVIVAFCLAFISSSLKDKQAKNVEQDTKKQILAALNITDVKNANQEFDKYVKSDLIINENGTVEEYDYKSKGFVSNFSKDNADNKRIHVFICEVDGQKKYVFPLYGAGLWGAIWGYISLNEDKSTVYGTNFSHAGETPGLGADIATEHFQKQFVGKTAIEDNNVILSVEKNGKVEDPKCQVDGITGGTITSKGVDQMIKDCLSRYTEFLTNNK